MRQVDSFYPSSSLAPCESCLSRIFDQPGRRRGRLFRNSPVKGLTNHRLTVTVQRFTQYFAALNIGNEESMSTELTGAEITVRCLQKEGVDYIFGYPGGAVLFIYDELFKQDKVKHVLVRHEQAAVHAADGYARSSNKVGVALVTSGPGVTNAVTGIATAYMDSIPLVIISGQVPTHAIGLDAFQEVDTVGITRPCVKHNFLVKEHRLSWRRLSRKRSTLPLPAAPGRCWWIFQRM